MGLGDSVVIRYSLIDFIKCVKQVERLLLPCTIEGSLRNLSICI